MFTDVLFEVADGVGKATLNRPQQMNALTLDMIRALDDKLVEWAADKSIRAVMIYGAGDKAFCAGGDIRALYDAKQNGNAKLLSEFFWHEYRLDYRIATYPKDLITVMDGLTMGGGAGIGLNAPVRVASERVVFSLPECTIGLYPDIGAAHFLQRCPGEIGMFLALTGLRLRTAGLYYCNLVTHTIPADRLPSLMPETLSVQNVATRAADIAKLQPAIDICFGLNSIDAILTALANRNDPGSQDALNLLRRGSPTSLKVTFEHVRRMRSKSLADVLKENWRISQHMMAGTEFFEGVRAVLIERDNAPKWNPATPSEVSEVVVNRYFERLSGQPDLDLKLR
ncbi:enoyl-CoA hydratase/isomerase family protein [Dongia deserti]|uniref:enoyl-CoA hydratase/isomerase family protein n=1 Tax=Dongia deserti TaxID=2268030 RepID=UPI0013C4FBDF|nr:enoyl-CoA hydratase/isomerase family protein [Dongia deserti]